MDVKKLQYWPKFLVSYKQYVYANAHDIGDRGRSSQENCRDNALI